MLNPLGTHTRGVFVYDGEASDTFGMVVSEAPAFEKPKRRNTVYSVPGRNGSIINQEDCYDDVSRTYKVWVADDGAELSTKVNNITSWLYSKTGYLRLEDDFEPDYFRLGYYDGGNNISNELTQYGETSISFTCRPERFLKSGEEEITISNGAIVYNPTRFASRPLLHIEGSGAISVSISGYTIICAVTDYINIDCDRMNAYRLPSENKNGSISGTFPKIYPGDNTISITGTASKVIITPRYYTI